MKELVLATFSLLVWIVAIVIRLIVIDPIPASIPVYAGTLFVSFICFTALGWNLCKMTILHKMKKSKNNSWSKPYGQKDTL